MAQQIPLFPLQLAVFPGEQIRLHIFEPRYKQLIGECRDQGSTFGIPPFIDGGVAEYGTLMRLVEIFREYPGGEMDILAEGMTAFRLLQFMRNAPEKLYPAGEVELLENDPGAPQALRQRLIDAYRKLQDVMQVPRRHDHPPGPELSFNLAVAAGLTLLQRIQLLALQREEEREEFLLRHLEQLVPMLEAADESRRHMQGNGKPKKFPPLPL